VGERRGTEDLTDIRTLITVLQLAGVKMLGTLGEGGLKNWTKRFTAHTPQKTDGWDETLNDRGNMKKGETWDESAQGRKMRARVGEHQKAEHLFHKCYERWAAYGVVAD